MEFPGNSGSASRQGERPGGPRGQACRLGTRCRRHARVLGGAGCGGGRGPSGAVWWGGWCSVLGHTGLPSPRLTSQQGTCSSQQPTRPTGQTKRRLAYRWLGPRRPPDCSPGEQGWAQAGLGPERAAPSKGSSLDLSQGLLPGPACALTKCPASARRG